LAPPTWATSTTGACSSNLHAAGALAVDDRIEPPLAEGLHHLHVLGLHQGAHVGDDVLALDGVGVGALVALEDPAAVGEEVGDDVRLAEARVLGLHVVVACPGA